MVVPHQRAERLLTVVQGAEFRHRRRLEDKGQVRLVAEQRRDGVHVVAHVHGEGHQRVAGAVGLDLVRHYVVGEGLAARDGHVAAPHAPKVGDLRAQLAEIQEWRARGAR